MTSQRIPQALALTLTLAALAGCDPDTSDVELLDASDDDASDADEPAPSEPTTDTPVSELPGFDELLTTPETETTVSAAINLALNKPAIQSSTAYGGDPSRTVDGNTDGIWWNGSLNHTVIGQPGWWQVDLLSIQPIGEIVVHNRTDCCAQLLHDFDVQVSKDGVNWETFHQAGVAPTRTQVLVDRTARYVRIQNPEVLHMAEVEVFRTRNLAYGKPASQSTTAFGGDPARAVDGNTDGLWWDNSVSHTGDGIGEWWQVDLQAIEYIGDVVLFNRTDCCADKLHDFAVQVSNDGVNWHSLMFEGAHPERHIVASINREARYVRVVNGGGYLHLAEVQVFEGLRGPGLTYGRGVGTIPGYGCALGQVMDAGLCYDSCVQGYTGVLTVCWEDCAPGYTDMGLTCTNWGTLHTYWKHTYDRGIGLLPSADCGNKEYDAGLCYDPCAGGTHGVGPVCWSDGITIQTIGEELCRGFRNPVMTLLSTESGAALTTGVGLGIAAFASASAEIGLAYGSDGEFGCYVSGCVGATTAVEISGFASLGVYGAFSDIAGDSNVASAGLSVGIPIPETPLAIGISGTLGMVSNNIGPIGGVLTLSGSFGLNNPVPLSLSDQVCHTEMLVPPA